MGRAIWAGLDVGVETTSICVIDDAGAMLQECTCATTLADVEKGIRWLRRRRTATVGMEAPHGFHLARGLRSRGYKVELYEARQLSKFLRVRRNKTDASDAVGIAEVGRLGQTLVSKVYLKSLECQSLQSRLTIRRRLIRQRVAMTNLLCRQLEHYGGRISRAARSPQLLRAQVEKELTKLFGKAPNALTRALRDLLSHSEALLLRQRSFDREFARLANEIEVCRRFMTVPGVGCLGALTFYATISEPGRFVRSSDVGAYLGLTPRIHQSGLTARPGRISKMGNVAARSALVGASNGFMKWSGESDPLRTWAAAIEQRRGRPKARIALARKLAVIMLAMWKSGECYRSDRMAGHGLDNSGPDSGKPHGVGERASFAGAGFAS